MYESPLSVIFRHIPNFNEERLRQVDMDFSPAPKQAQAQARTHDEMSLVYLLIRKE